MGVTRREPLPGDGLDVGKMPGHWLLARMGKRVLRPGGLESTRRLLHSLKISSADTVVELAPGLGATARIALLDRPASYVGVERDEAAVLATQRILRPYSNAKYECRQGTAERTGLEAAFATVLYGEAMLTMQSSAQKREIVREAFRVLSPGGRYGIHELGLEPDDLEEATKSRIMEELSAVIHVGARPQTVAEWAAILEEEGFLVRASFTAPMRLLEPTRVVRDEGIRGALRIVGNLLRNPVARRRVVAMRRLFRRHAKHLCAVTIVAEKPRADAASS
ncbi:MAG: methyltransferase domain-containing protein [Thermoanaerobaculia bacterium]|nr:methyltransferase domain-containing protein [Thermoanaerobaculia bacterium]